VQVKRCLVIFAVASALLLCCWFTAHSAVIRVPADQPTIQFGINAAVDGDTVLVDPGTYAECIDFGRKGITVASSGGPEVTVIDGNWMGSTVTISGTDEKPCRLQGFTIRSGYPVHAYIEYSSAFISGNIFKSAEYSEYTIYINNAAPVVMNNIFRDMENYYSSLSVLKIISESSPVVVQNIFYNNIGIAIHIIEPATGSSTTKIANNTIVGNSYGIVTSYNPSQHLYKNNIIAGNGIGFEMLYGASDYASIFQNNLVFGNTLNYSEVSNLTGIYGNISADPMFFKPSDNDFHLRSGSPAIDAGNSDSLSLPATDFDGTPRVLDGIGGTPIVDMGAYEFDREAAPGVLLYADVASGATPLNVQFTSTVDRAVNEYSWDFGDGTSSTEANPAHTFLPGIYTVTLTVSGNTGSTTVTRTDMIESYVAYQITASAGTGGTVSPSGVIEVKEGSSLTINIDPDPGYRIGGVLIDGQPAGEIASYEFSNIYENHTIEASFVAIFHIESWAGPGGNIDPLGYKAFDGASSSTFTINPDEGYGILNVYVDSVSVGPISSYKFDNIGEGHKIYAIFAPLPIGNPLYSITNLGTLGGTNSQVSDINDSGQAVGYSMLADNTTTHGWLYSNGTLTDLGTLGGTFCSAAGINNSSQVVGSSNITDDVATRAFIYANGEMTDLGTLGGTNSWARDINDSGQVAGSSGITGDGEIHAFLYSGGIMIDLGTLGGGYSEATGINSSGQVVGISYIVGGVYLHAFLYSGGVMTDLGTLGGTWSFAKGINNLGQVVGYSATADGQTHAFLYSGGVMTDLGNVADSSYGLAINDLGQVTGSYATPSEDYPILYNNGVLADLNSAVPNTGWTLFYPFGINNIGQIVAIGASGINTHPFLLTPIITHTITAGADEHGSISPSGPVSVDQGLNQAFTITPDQYYHIADVAVDGSSVGTNSTYTFEDVTADHSISASFAIDTFKTTASAGQGGSISPSGITQVNALTNQTFTITPDAHYHVLDVVVDGSSVGVVGSYQFSSITANHTISVTFEHDPLTISASAGDHGSINPANSVSVPYQQSRSFTFTPEANYHVQDVVVDGVSVGVLPGYTFENVIENHTISVSFAINQHTITSSAGLHGLISPSGSVKVNYGSSKEFTITPDAGFRLKNLVVDGVSVGRSGKYTFSNVKGNHTISAAFESDPNKVLPVSVLLLLMD